MIKVRLIAVGKIKEEYYKKAVEEYAKRLSRYCEFSLVEVKEENYNVVPDDATVSKILSVEGERLSLNSKGHTVAFAIEGKKHSSKDLANLIKRLIDGGNGEISFLIGGSYGIDEKVKNKADIKLSMSDMTFPHALFRVMAVEQIYRAFCINAGSNYHK